MFAKQHRIPPLNLTAGWYVVIALVILPALYVELTGDFPGRVIFYGQEEDSWLAGVFLNAHVVIMSLPAVIWQTIEGVLGSIANFFA